MEVDQAILDEMKRLGIKIRPISPERLTQLFDLHSKNGDLYEGSILSELYGHIFSMHLLTQLLEGPEDV